MIHTNRIVTVGEQESIIDRPIILYRGDREVEIEFTLVGNEFMFSEEGNVIKSVNASHGQLVLNTPSGEHMFSELAECHEGKVVFIVTKEMIDEFIEVGFYSFQIRLYDSAEMKSRVTIPPVMNGFDIRNPIAAEDEVNIVDQGLVDYARVFKDQSNEELPTFDWTGAYNKTEWEHHDVITENKLNKIEDALYSINANTKELGVDIPKTLDQVKKDADKYVKEHIADIEADVEEFERNLNTDVQKFKIDTNAAMTTHKNEVSEVIDGFDARLVDIENYVTLKTFGYNGDSETDSTIFFEKAFEYLQSLGGGVLTLDSGVYKCNIEIPSGILIRGKSIGGMSGSGVQGTILKAYDHMLPIIRIGGNVKAIGVENITVEGRVGDTPTSEIGLLIDGATEIKFDNILLKYCKTNCIVRNNGTIPTYFVYFNNSSSVRASLYNMKIEQDGNTSGFVTAIYFNNFASNNYFANTSSAEEGAVLYTQAEIFTSNTWLEANSDNFVVVDKSTNSFARIKASNTAIDGGTFNSVVKCYGASTIGIPDFIQGNISVDGKLSLDDTDKIVDVTSRGAHLYRPRTSNAELGGLTYFLDVNQVDVDPKQLPYMCVSNGSLVINAANAKSKGVGVVGSYASPFLISSSDGASRLWYKDNMLYCKSFGGSPTSSTDGNIVMSYQVNPPASKTSHGKIGYISADDTYVYICVSDSNWIRIKKDTEW